MSDGHSSAHLYKDAQSNHRGPNPLHSYGSPSQRSCGRVRYQNYHDSCTGKSCSKRSRRTVRSGMSFSSRTNGSQHVFQGYSSTNDGHFPNWKCITYDEHQELSSTSRYAPQSISPFASYQNPIAQHNSSSKHYDEHPEHSFTSRSLSQCNSSFTSCQKPIPHSNASFTKMIKNNCTSESEEDQEKFDSKTYQESYQSIGNREGKFVTKTASSSGPNKVSNSNKIQKIPKFKKSLSGWYFIKLWRRGIMVSWEDMRKIVCDYVHPTVFQYYKLSCEKFEYFSCFVCDMELAEKLYSYEGMNSNVPKVSVLSTQAVFELQGITLEILASVISKRYNSNLKQLDLSKLHDDPDLLLSNCLVHLGRANTVKRVFSMVSSTLPDVESINLNDNKIFQNESLAIVASSAPRLKTLHLKNNHFRKISDLISLKALNLHELSVAGNPLSLTSEDTMSIVIKMFPTLVQLDGVAVIDFDKKVEKPQNLQLLCSNPVFMISNDVKLFVKSFINEYMEVFDSNSREKLAGCYHPDACFSLVALDGKGKNTTISSLIKRSRNLLRIKDDSRQFSLLQQGRDNIIAFLNQLPSMRHQPNCLTCDCPIATSQLSQISLTGLYEVISMADETQFPVRSVKSSVEDSNSKSLIYFNRVFLFTPTESGDFLISSEQMFVTNRTMEQYVQFFSRIHGLRHIPDEEINYDLDQVKILSLAASVSLHVAEEFLSLTSFDYDRALKLCLSLKQNVAK